MTQPLRPQAFTLIELPKAVSKGFTLIELLVVITIIVVLLALLTPALDKAIYQAQLVKCAAQMKVVAGGATLYAFDHKRRYMYRETAAIDYGYNYNLRGPGGAAASIDPAADSLVDDRPVHKGYIDLDLLMDPLAERVDLKEQPGELEHPNETIYTNYVMWYGWEFKGRQGMKRLGDRWVGHDAKRGRDFEFQWLLSDMDLPSRLGAGGATAGHPDVAEGTMTNIFAQAGKYKPGEGTEAEAGAVILEPSIPITYSFWNKSGGINHGKMDLNFASADGSVIRLNAVKNEHDERIAHMPTQRIAGSFNIWLNTAKP